MRAFSPLAHAIRPWATAALAGMVALTPALIATPTAAADPPELVLTGRINVGGSPHGLAVTPNGKRVYVANSWNASVSVIDTASQQVTDTVALPRIGGKAPRPRSVSISPDGSAAYVSSADTNTVSVINTSDNKVTKTIDVGLYPNASAITPDGTRLYVVTDESNEVSVINTATGEVIKTIQIQGGPWSVAITPDGSAAYVVTWMTDSVSVINTVTNEVTTPAIPVGDSPEDIAITPDGSVAYVTESGTGNVSVIDTATKTVTDTITGFGAPSAIAITPDGGSAYVADGDVSVIDTATKQITESVTGLERPYDIAITPDGSAAYVTEFLGTVWTGRVAVLSIQKPIFKADRQTITFADQQVDATSDPETVTVTNTGATPLTISDVNLGGANATDFTINATDCATAPLQTGQSCTADVSLTPASSGAKTATLNFTHNAGGTASTVALRGTAIGTSTPDPTTDPTTQSTPAPSPTAAGTREQHPANGRGIPPKRVHSNGVTLIQGKNARTNAGQPIRTLVTGQPTGSSIAGETRHLTVIRGPKGKVSVRTYGTPVRIEVRQRAAATDAYLPYQRKTVYVTG